MFRKIIKTILNLPSYTFFIFIGFFIYAVCLSHLNIENEYIGFVLFFLPPIFYVLLESVSPRNPLVASSNVIIVLVAFFVGLNSGSEGIDLNSLDNLAPAIILIFIAGGATLVLSSISQIVRKKFGFRKYVALEYKREGLVFVLGVSYLLGAALKVYYNWELVISRLNFLDISRIAIYLSIIGWIIIGVFLIRRSKWAKVTAGISGISYYLFFTLMASAMVSEIEFYAISQIIRPPFLELSWFLGYSGGSTVLAILGLHLLSIAHPEPLIYFRKIPFKTNSITETKMNEADLIELGEQYELSEEHFRKGQQLRDEKDFEGAISQFEEAIKLNPKDWRAYDEIAYWLTDKLENPQKGLEYAKKAIELVPKDSSNNYAAVLDTIGWCYCKLGKVKEAKEHLENAVKVQSHTDAFFILRVYHLLVVYEKIENIQGAKEIYRKIEPIEPIDWINAEAKEKADEVIKRIKHLERQREKHKINEFANYWDPVCNLEERKCPPNEIMNALEQLEHDRDGVKSKIESLIIDYPLDPVVAHCLALMHYWETKADKGDSDIWIKFIAYWVRLIYLDEFWGEWKKEREKFYFRNVIEIEEMDDLHRFIGEMVEQKVPDLYRGYLLLERKTAETIRRLNEWGVELGLSPIKLICGPIMLKELRVEDKFKTIATLGLEKFSLNSDFENLMLYLSPLGLATTFIEEKNIEKALQALGEIRTTEIPEIFRKKYADTVIEIAEQQTSSEKVKILRQALQRIEDKALRTVLFNEYEKMTDEFAKDNDWDQAANSLELALEIEPHNDDTENKLFISYLNSAAKKLEANKPEGAVIIIERAEKLKLDGDRKGSLADICFGCAIKFMDTDKPENAEIMAKKAEKYDSANKEIKQLLDAIKLLKIYGKEVLNFLGQARQAASNNNWDGAIEKYRRALRRAEDKRLSIEAIKEIKCELAFPLNQKAIEKANEIINQLNSGRVTQTDACIMLQGPKRDIEEANSLCPENMTIRQNLNGIKTTIANLNCEHIEFHRHIIGDKKFNSDKWLEELMKRGGGWRI